MFNFCYWLNEGLINPKSNQIIMKSKYVDYMHQEIIKFCCYNKRVFTRVRNTLYSMCYKANVSKGMIEIQNLLDVTFTKTKGLLKQYPRSQQKQYFWICSMYAECTAEKLLHFKVPRLEEILEVWFY